MSDKSIDISEAISLPAFASDWEKNVPYMFAGVGIVIEYLQGDVRTKTSKDGVVIETLMPAAYGYVLRTTDIHGEEIDMYLANMPDEEALIFVIDQVNPATGAFDEHKVMFGFSSVEEATQTYIDVFGDASGDKRLGFMTSFTKDAFQSWITEDGASLMPASNFKRDDIHLVYKGVGITPFNKPSNPAPRDAAGGVIIELPDLSNGPVIKTLSAAQGSFDYHLYFYSGLDTVTWSNVTDTFCRLLDMASAEDTAHVHISSPGGSVPLMGRIVSAMNRTKAKVFTYAEGCVASAATSIWSAGHERHILPGSFFMQHMSSQILGGKTTDIAAKSVFGAKYIEIRLKRLIEIGLFTQEEITDMVEKSADIYISGREAIARMGAISYRS